MKSIPYRSLFALLSRCRRMRVDALLLLLTLLTAAMALSLFGGEPLLSQLGNTPEPSASPVATPQQMKARTAPARRAARAQAGEPVRFLMFNVRNYFVAADEPRSPHRNPDKRLEEREAVAEVIASAEPAMVGLVEIGGPAALADLQKRLKARGAEYPYSCLLPRAGEARALALLSRYPLAENNSVAQCPLREHAARGYMLRGILDVTVLLPDERTFRIVGAHLKSRYAESPAESAKAAALRAAELRTLAHYLQGVIQQQPEQPLLLFGDWNGDPGETKMLTQNAVSGVDLHRVSAADSRGEKWTIRYGEEEIYSTFDRIYVNKSLSKRMGRAAGQGGIVDVPAAAKASDHRAVWCELR